MDGRINPWNLKMRPQKHDLRPQGSSSHVFGWVWKSEIIIPSSHIECNLWKWCIFLPSVSLYSFGGPMRRDPSWGNGLLSAQLQRKTQSVFQQGGYDEEIPYCNETIAIYQILPMSEKWLYQSDLCLIYPSIFSAEIIPEILIVRENYIPISCRLNRLNQKIPQHIPILYFLVE